jgi:hypothetical protein
MNRFLFAMILSAMTLASVDAQHDVTAAQVNGTWKLRDNEFKIWALGQQKLQIEFSGIYEYNSPHGPMANEGEATGIARIEGDTAIFKPERFEEDCQIELKFSRGKLLVTQIGSGTCGFGHNVRADGTYTKVSSKKPKFDAE